MKDGKNLIIMYILSYICLITLATLTAYVFFDYTYYLDDPIGIILIVDIVLVALLSISLFFKKTNILKYILYE